MVKFVGLYSIWFRNFSSIFNGCFCCNVFIIVKNKDHRLHYIYILALMGKIPGGASNLSSGGIGVGFDFETGKFNDFGIRYKRFCEDGEWLCNEHPDTGVRWIDECLPNWKYVKNKVEHVCSHITSLDYLGFDIIITSTGLKFCEINTHPAADYEQVMCNPILQDEKNVDFFRSKGLFEIDTERFFELYAQSH